MLAASRDQARVVFEYCLAFLEQSPILRQELLSVTASEIRLRGNLVIGVHCNSFRNVRGRTLIACIFDECSVLAIRRQCQPGPRNLSSCTSRTDHTARHRHAGVNQYALPQDRARLSEVA